MAMSEKPEKSRQICTAKKSMPSHSVIDPMFAGA